MPSSSRIRATLHGAARIPKMDALSQADPYVRLRCQGKTARTSTQSETGAPVWGEVLEIVVDADEEGVVEFELWDADLGPDDLIGVVAIPLSYLKSSPRRGGTFDLDLAPGLEPIPEGPPQLTLDVELTPA